MAFDEAAWSEDLRNATPAGPWGLVYLIARDAQGKLRLDHLAFGLRHPPAGRRPTVYRLAHRRLHE